MAVEGLRLKVQIAGMVSVHEKVAILTVLEVFEELECNQIFVKRVVLFAEIEKIGTKLEPEPSMILFLPCRIM